MNIIDIQDQLKNFSENQLIQEMQAPSGSAPQFLVLSEIQRRKRVRDDFSKRQAAQEPTVAEEAVAAAGVPMQGIAGMSEAMAPQSAASSGIGTIMPEAMRQSASMPSPEEEAMAMRSGGLLSYGEELSQRMSQDRIDPFLDEVEQMADSRFGISSGAGGLNKFSFDYQQLPGPRIPNNYPTPFAQPVAEPAYPIMPHAVKGKAIGQIMPAAMQASQFRGGSLSRYAEGGVLRAQQGMYMPEDPILRALMMQESRGDPMATGSVGEIGAFQIRPETALMPGYGIKSLFPEISAQIGAAKKYKTASEAYKANKELIDSVLRDTKKAEDFAGDYLGKAEDRLGSLESALLAYNRGISGAGKVEDPTQDPYYKGVMGFMDSNDEFPATLADRGVTAADLNQPDADPNFMSAMAATNETSSETNPVLDFINKNILGPKGRELFGTESEEDFRAKEGRRAGEQFGERLDYEISRGIESSDEYQDAVRRAAITGKAPPSPSEFRSAMADATRSGEKIGERAAYQESLRDGLSDEEKKAAIAAQNEAETPKDTSPLADDTKAPTSKEPMTVEQEIIQLQKDMEKSREQDKWLAIAQAGLALMSSKEPTLLGAAGEAGISGLKSFREAQDRYQEGVIDLINARAKLSKNEGNFTVRQMIQSATDLRSMAKQARDAGQEGKARQFELAADSLLANSGSIGSAAAGVITGQADE
jgi:hypothetical protein